MLHVLMTCSDPSCLYLKLLATARVSDTLSFLTSPFHSPPVLFAPPLCAPLVTGMASQVQVFSPHTLQSSAFFSVKKLKVEQSCNWDMTGYGTHSKVYSHNSSKNLSAASGPLGINSSLQVASSTLPYEQALIFPASAGHIVVASASSTSGAVGSLLGSGGGGSNSNSSGG